MTINIRQALIEAAKKLKLKKIKNPHLEAEILLSLILKKPREFILAHPEKKLTKLRIAKYASLIKKRAKGMPAAYLAGRREFYGFDFLVNKNVLIPRPETEMMVEEALKIVKSGPRPKAIIDVGAGSGCVIITLAKLLNLKTANQEPRLMGIDISEPALKVAKKNALMHKVSKKIKFYHGSLLEPVLKKSQLKNPNLKIKSASQRTKLPIIVLANLPYLTPDQIKKSPTIKYEPKLALSAGSDGLKYYRLLLKQIKKSGEAFPAPFYALCEIDSGQAKKIKLLVKKELPQARLQIKKDLAGLNRLAIIKI